MTALRELGTANDLERLLGAGEAESGENEGGKWDDVFVSAADEFPDSPVVLGGDVQPKL